MKSRPPLARSSAGPARRARARAVAALASAGLLAGFARAVPGDLARARELFAADQRDGAREAALAALARDPYSIEAYRLLHDLASREGDDAGRLRWGKWLHWSAHYSGRQDEAKALSAELIALHPDANRDEVVLDGWRASVDKAVRAAASAKQYRAAGHLMGKLIDLDPADADLRKQYDALYEKAGATVGGGAFVAERVRRRSPRWLARTNREHSEWEDAFSRKTEHYKIVTNISYEFFETVSVVMEDMYDFYQLVYGYRKKAPTVTLAIHRRRSDFDRYCHEVLRTSLSLGVGGWFWDDKMTVAAFDRTEQGENLRDLWRVLFHEASHQFMHLLTKSTKQDPPTWLNEGTASYFEGCELKADGSIVKNKPAVNRAFEWEYIENGDRRHSLKELITCRHREYDGSFYSYGWALVYFLNNYEDEQGDAIYREPYLEYLNSYTKKSRGDDEERRLEAFERAVEMFVDDVADPAVPDWAAFEERWRTWTKDVVAEVKAGPELADELQERCQRYLARGDHERALITAERADDKRPGDAETYRLLGMASWEAERREDAVYWMLRYWEDAFADQDAERLASAERWLGEHGAESLARDYCAATRAALEAVGEAMTEVAEAGQPVLAQLFASHAMQAFGVEPRPLLAEVERLAQASGQSLRLWQAAFPESSDANSQWRGVDVVRYDADGVLVNSPSPAVWPAAYCNVPTLAPLAPPFDVRGSVQVEGEFGAYVYLGIGRDGMARCALRFLPSRQVEVQLLDLSHATDAENEESSNLSVVVHRGLASAKAKSAEGALAFQLEIADDGGWLRLPHGDDAVELELPAEVGQDRLTGRMSLVVGPEAVALFKDVQVRPRRPFWPVRPSTDAD